MARYVSIPDGLEIIEVSDRPEEAENWQPPTQMLLSKTDMNDPFERVTVKVPTGGLSSLF